MSNDANLCACGCGTPAGVYASGGGPDKVTKGQPKRFVRGHHSRLPEYQRQSLPFDECYTVQANGCWRWNVIRAGDDGYGRYWIDGHKFSAHRLAYEYAHGAIPNDARVDHLCHEPATCAGGVTCPHRACVNPGHLQLLSHADNCRRGVNAKITAEQATEIRARRAAGERGVDLATEFGVRASTISWIATGKTWKGAD